MLLPLVRLTDRCQHNCELFLVCGSWLQDSAEALERLLCAFLRAQALKESAGCTCAGAMNYDPSATVDDGSCEMPEVLPTLPNLLASYIQHHRTCVAK